MPADPRLAWADGRIVPIHEGVVRGDDGAFASGWGCYTTARFESGRVRHGPRSARRLARDARTLGLGVVDEASCLRAMTELGAAQFGPAAGIVRMQASVDRDGRLHLVATARPLGPEPAVWRVQTHRLPHDGPGAAPGVKLTGHPRFALARRELEQTGLDEALFYDSSGFLVEGARSSLVVCDARGFLGTPPLARGGVAGVAREILLERVPELDERDWDRGNVFEASEVVAVNAVRGARPVVAIDGRPVGSGRPGPWATALAHVLLHAE